MKIARIEFQPYTRSIDIFVSGCREHSCKGCHNEGLWSFDVGKEWKTQKEYLLQKLEAIPFLMAQNIWIMGGEPLDQDHVDFVEFLMFLNDNKEGRKITLFTGKEVSQIPTSLYELLDFVKTGAYLSDRAVDCHVEHGIKLASSNQHVFEVSKAST